MNYKQLVFLLSLLIFEQIKAQTAAKFTAQEKAYMFHAVMKSPILKSNIGQYFEYSGPKIIWRDTILNYDSIETLIINQPELLFIRSSEIAKCPPGLVAELANKMALWELNKTLMAFRENDKPEQLSFQKRMNSFNDLLVKNLPPSALVNENDSLYPNPKMQKVFNPSLAFDDKTTLLNSFHLFSIEEQQQVIQGMNKSINEWVQNRTYELFCLLGGKTTHFNSQLIAAGDGSNTSGMFNEREKDETGRWNRGLPKAVGLFPYQFHIEQLENAREKELQPERFAFLNFKTAGQDRQTHIHADVWGYNAKKQTTVVIEKNNKSYVLFGAGDTRFLSPDSSFSEGSTFYALINELKYKWIAQLKETIYGKNGIDSQIKAWQKREASALLEIKTIEKRLSDQQLAEITTTKQGIKERKKDQQLLVDKYNEYENCKKKVAQYEKEKAQALLLLDKYQLLLDKYQKLIGTNWAKWIENKGLYTYEDGATFNLSTQEFVFPPSKSAESFQVRLIAIPFTALSQEADEVMLHVSVSDEESGYDKTIQLAGADLFASNSAELNDPLFTASDSVAVLNFFKLLLKKPDVEVIARGQGIGKWEDGKISKWENAIQETSYPGNSTEERQKSKEDTLYKRLRRSELSAGMDNNKLVIEVNSYTDPVRSSFQTKNALLIDWLTKKQISENDALSAYRTANLLQHFKNELNVKAGLYLSREQAKIVIDYLNRSLEKVRISVGKNSVSLNEL